MLKHIQLHAEHSQISITPEVITSMQQKMAALELPSFQQHQVDLGLVQSIVKKYLQYENIIIISNGGSRTSALAYWQSLAHLRNTKQVEFLSTMEPDVIARLKAQYSPETTLVMPISKSGTNVDVLEPLLQFLEYPILPVTSPEEGVLYDIAKVYGWDIIPHPEVGGRYSGRSECGFAPAFFMGLDIEKINTAAVRAYESLDYAAPLEQNIAFQAAAMCAQLEQKSIDEIFMPVYSQPLAGFLPLIVQLIHESTGKDGKGQTIFGDEAPESQHHTNQRFFGGQKNVMGWFVTVAKQHNQLNTAVPEKIAHLPLREGTMKSLDAIPLSDALRFDYEGVAENATKMNIPHMTIEIDMVNEESVGEFLSFLHYYTVYSALLRDQDPFDQPEVEAAKDISFTKRLEYQS